MKISLITTTKNRPSQLLECALSVANQSYQCHEWIIYIDQPLKEYRKILDLITTMIPQAKILGGLEHIGRVTALSEAHKQVTGDYCGLLDDDDKLDKDCLKHCSLWDSDIIYTDFYYVQDGIKAVSTRNSVEYSWEKMLKDNIMFHFRLYKTTLYHTVGGFDLTFDTTMDYDLTLRMLALKPSITKINLPLYYYTVHPESISSKNKERQAENKKRAVLKYVS